MKRMIYKRKLISCVVIWSVLIGSLLLYSPNNDIALSASGVPEIKILTPNAGAVLNESMVEIAGKISEDQTSPDKFSVRVFEQLGDLQQPMDITDEGKIMLVPNINDANFSFSKHFSDGEHTLTFVVSGGGVSNKADYKFTVSLMGKEQKNETNIVDKEGSIEPSTKSDSVVQSLAVKAESGQPSTEENANRPSMGKMFLIPKGEESKYDLTKETVPDNFYPAEDMTRVPLNYQILIDIRSTESLREDQSLISFFGGNGKEQYVGDFEHADGIKSYLYTFTPEKQLDPRTTYYVYLNPEFSNQSGNKIIPRFLKFTTASKNHQDEKDFNDVMANIPDHQRSLDSKIHGPFSNVTNACAYCHSTHEGKNTKLIGGEFGTKEENLCMACHDGTMGSKIGPEVTGNNEMLKPNQHYQKSSNACTSCHNPHTPGTPENPNSLKMDSSKSHILAYKKAGSADGKPEDFSLCFSCHKSGGNASDIEQYYKNSESAHMIKSADNGSPLNGHLPCAECHETHGSSNIKMLRANLGNIQPDKTLSKFSKTDGDWDNEAERAFCLSCHTTENKPELYGKTVKIDTGIADHTDVNNLVCSSCHGDGDNPFRSAAHAPTKTPKKPGTETSAQAQTEPGNP